MHIAHTFQGRSRLRLLFLCFIVVLLMFGLVVQMRHGSIQDLTIRFWMLHRYQHSNVSVSDVENSTNSSQPEVIYYVTQHSGNFDNRRLGNQLFNFAAALYVTKRSNDRRNLPPISPRNATILRKDRLMAMPRHHPHGWLDQWFDVKVARYENHKGR